MHLHSFEKCTSRLQAAFGLLVAYLVQAVCSIPDKVTIHFSIVVISPAAVWP
jgi:hypothetical protein